MNIKINVKVDEKTGQYNIEFNSLNDTDIDYFLLKKVFYDWFKKIDNSGNDNNENIFKEVH